MIYVTILGVIGILLVVSGAAGLLLIAKNPWPNSRIKKESYTRLLSGLFFCVVSVYMYIDLIAQ